MRDRLRNKMKQKARKKREQRKVEDKRRKEMGIKDDASIDELLAFINGESNSNQQSKSKKKRKKRSSTKKRSLKFRSFESENVLNKSKHGKESENVIDLCSSSEDEFTDTTIRNTTTSKKKKRKKVYVSVVCG